MRVSNVHRRDIQFELMRDHSGAVVVNGGPQLDRRHVVPLITRATCAGSPEEE